MPILNYILGIAIANAQVTGGAAVDKVASGTTSELSKLVGNFFAQIPLWIAAAAVAVLSYIVAIMVRKAIEGKLAQNGIAEEHKEIQIVASRTSFFVVLVIGATVALSIVGIDLAPIVAAGAFGLGFALQDIIMNMISGMFILASRHYTIGDVIKVGDVAGKIEEIQTRATIIKGFDGTRIVVPNAQLFKNVVISKTSNPYRKVSFVMGVDYGADLTQAMELTLAVVKSIPWVLKKPKPKVIFYEWGDYSINFKINVWIDSKGGKLLKVKNAVIIELSKAYNESGISIPYPIQTIQLDKADQAQMSQQEIDQKVANIKQALKEKNRAKIVPQGFSAATPAPTTILTPAATEPNPSTAPLLSLPATMPTAIQTTPNSPGQSWLQEALQKQLATTGNNPPITPQPLQPVIDTTPQPAPTPVTSPTPESQVATVFQAPPLYSPQAPTAPQTPIDQTPVFTMPLPQTPPPTEQVMQNQPLPPAA